MEKLKTSDTLIIRDTKGRTCECAVERRQDGGHEPPQRALRHAVLGRRGGAITNLSKGEH